MKRDFRSGIQRTIAMVIILVLFLTTWSSAALSSNIEDSYIARGEIPGIAFPSMTGGASANKIIAISAGMYNFHFLVNDGTVWVYYNGEWDQVYGLENIVSIDCGWQYNIALDANGNVWEWESDWGAGYTPPDKITELSNIIQISNSDGNCMALAEDGEVWEWRRQGYRYSGIPTGPTQRDLGGYPCAYVAAGSVNFAILEDSPYYGRTVVGWPVHYVIVYSILDSVVPYDSNLGAYIFATEGDCYIEKIYNGIANYWASDDLGQSYIGGLHYTYEFAEFGYDDIVDVGTLQSDIYSPYEVFLKSDGTVWITNPDPWWPSVYGTLTEIDLENIVDVTLAGTFLGYALDADGIIYIFDARNGAVTETITDFAGMPVSLFWPVSSGEVTLWYGQIDHLYTAEHKGLNIQNATREFVRSISDGVVSHVGYDPIFKNVVFVDFTHNGWHMQARYGHLASNPGVSVGQTISAGQAIGRMALHDDTGKGLLQVVLRKSTNGQACLGDGTNSVPVDPMDYLERPEYDKLYITRPYTTLLDINGLEIGSGVAPAVSQTPSVQDIRYMLNLDIDTESECYLRKFFEDCVNKKNTNSNNSLTYNEATNTTTIKLNGTTWSYGPNLGNVRMVNSRMVVDHEELWSRFIVGSSEKYARVITDGESAVVSGTEYWFIAKDILGATDFEVTSNINATIIVYKKTLLGKKQLYSQNGTSLTRTLSDSMTNNGANTYLVHIKSSSLSVFTCKINTHIDSRTSSTGGTWTPYEYSARYDPNILYTKYYYADASRVSDLYIMVSHADFLDFQEDFANGTRTLVSAALGLGFPAATNKVLGVLFTAFSFLKPFEFKQKVLDDIDAVAGHQGQDSNNKPIYSRGICIIEYMYNGLSFYLVRPWEGSSMSGPRGWTGTWTINP